MFQTKFNIFALSSLLAVQAWGYGVGYSSYPMTQNMKIVSSELTGIFTDNKGAGIQVRYTHKLSKSVIMDAGVGIAGGDRDARAFAGIDYEIFPDYMKQPRFSVKASFERANEYGIARNNLALKPTVSKGFNFWGHEAFPFVALNTGLSLDGKTSTYQTQANGILGITGKVPIKNYNHLSANLETSINIKDSYTGLFVGLSYPFK